MATIKDPKEIRKISCVGTGTVGSGWVAYFLSKGFQVVATDPAPDFEKKLRSNIDRAWPKLERIGLSRNASRDNLCCTDEIEKAVESTDFVQESAPDDEALKIGLITLIDSACPENVLVASSSSEFLPSRLAANCIHPERVIIGHPFVPVYLVPLVEVVGASTTPVEVLDSAMKFYNLIGKFPVKLKKEIQHYIANRLQLAMYRESQSLVEEGVCEIKDIDDIVTHGFGLRLPILGPFLGRHLAGGEGGIRNFISHFGWEGEPRSKSDFIDSIERQWDHASLDDLQNWRDDNLVAFLKVISNPPKK